MAQNVTHRLPLSVIATQLTQQSGHTVTENDIRDIFYDPAASPTPTARVTLKPVFTSFLKTIEFFIFTRQQIVTFYNNVSGSSVVASTITNIRFDPDDPGSFVELVPPQT
jgi:hypothetical protein